MGISFHFYSLKQQEYVAYDRFPTESVGLSNGLTVAMLGMDIRYNMTDRLFSQ